MSVTGTLSTMALPDLLQWLAGSGKTGLLRLSNGRFRKDVQFREGLIVSTASDDPREFLGQFLLSHRRITEDQLRQAMETHRATGVMLGRILIMVGAIEEAELMRLLTVKAQESLFALFLWSDASFEFDDGAPPTEEIYPIRLKVEEVLLEGLRRYDELQVILKAFSSGDFVLRRTANPVPDRLVDNPLVRRLLEVVDGRRTLTDICLEMHASEFKISRVAYELHRHGCLAVEQEPAAAEAGATGGESSVELIAQAERQLAAQRFDEALDLLTRAAELRPSDLQLRARLDEVERDTLERAYRHALPPAHIVVLRRPLEELTGEYLTPQEMFLLSRINGSWTVKDVITISPLREIDAVRTLRSLRERGVIDVHPPAAAGRRVPGSPPPAP